MTANTPDLAAIEARCHVCGRRATLYVNIAPDAASHGTMRPVCVEHAPCICLGVQSAACDGKIADLTADRDRLSARVAELEKALKPFVFGDPALEEILWGHFADNERGTVTVRCGDFRRARAALATTERAAT